MWNNKSFVLLIFFFPIGSLFAEVCSTQHIRIYKNDKFHYKKVELCFPQKNKQHFYSKNCKSNKCEPLSREKVAIQLKYSRYGTPSSRFCRRLGGKPELLELKLDDLWKKTSWCFFKDNTIVSNQYLYSINKEYIFK